MKKSKVVVLNCSQYNSDSVYQKLIQGINLLGGARAFITAGEKILLKPNLLTARTPEQAVTTHPVVFEAVLRIFQEAGAVLSYGDSPGQGSPLQTARRAGLAEVAERYGVPLADFESGSTIHFPEGRQCNDFKVARGAAEADGIISLPKMKTHQLTRITGAVKNQLGCIYGFNKAGFHFRYPNPDHFCRSLVDINRLLRPRLFIMDGIIAMEGNGPSGGDPIQMNVLILSADPVAVDATFCRLIDLSPELVSSIRIGAEDGLGSFREEEIEYAGDPIDTLVNSSFKVVRNHISGVAFPRVLKPLQKLFLQKPVIDDSRCVRCGICIEACPLPEKAVEFGKKGTTEAPEYNYDSCIRCYCCQEMCPHKAITVRTPLLARIFR